MEALKYQKEMIEVIREKKELETLDDTLVLEKMEKLFLQEPKLLRKIIEKQKTEKFKEFAKSKAFDELVKKTRLALREIYGVFILPGYERKEKYVKAPSEEHVQKLLALHQSSRERLPFYKEIYEHLFSITGNPKTILDLGCGLNPCGYFFLGCKPEYTASDLNSKDCEFLNSFFKSYNINGKAIPFDLTKDNKYPKTDMCFLFKVVDSLETAKKNSTRNLLKALDCTWIIVSFPKLSLGQNKKIPESKRNWFFTMLQYEGYIFSRFEVSNELFVVIKKKS
jgi:hypothetical protein